MRKRLALLRALNLPLVRGLAIRHARKRTATHISTSESPATRHGAQRYALFIFVLMLGGLSGCGSSTNGATSTVTSVPVTPTLPTAPGGTVSATLKSVGGSIDVGYLYGMAADDAAVWVHNAERGIVSRIDPKTNKVVATIPVGQGLGDVVLGPGAVWVATRDDDTVSRIDPTTNRVVASIKLPLPAGFLAVSPGAVWVASKMNDSVWKIDPQTNQVVAHVLIDNGPSWMSFGAGSLWICNQDGEKFGVTRLDPTTNKVLAQIDIGSANNLFCGGTAATDGVVWVELMDNTGDHPVGLARIDPATNRMLATVPLLASISVDALAADAQGLWVADPGLGLLRISSQTNKAVSLLPRIGGAGLALGAGSVWLATNDGTGTLLRIAPTS